MPKKNSDGSHRARVLVLVDESNVGSSVRTAGRGLDWIKLRDFWPARPRARLNRDGGLCRVATGDSGMAGGAR